jgi:hypothetical protein
MIDPESWPHTAGPIHANRLIPPRQMGDLFGKRNEPRPAICLMAPDRVRSGGLHQYRLFADFYISFFVN